ncbi:UDP-N-acetylmuramate--L-alanine ligase [Sungkyunkwania multivorans]|uniref:UDP-N-acetylmuramate--L-alanine ligase n=1 Tax=Sungkyunkwania multivorans TaxID=1173618 RepID=A0ABW3D402_9FLAO
MNLNLIHNIYFIGIGGIGMSALARYFKTIGKEVAGYDRTPSEITDNLCDLGISIHFEDVVSKIPENFLNKEQTLVVYTPAVPKAHSELQYFNNNRFEVCKRSEVLGMITENTFCLAVAGTHGKTTTSSILTHLLNESGQQVTGFLGGIAENYDSNLVMSGNEYTVVEADEFDRSFLQLSPDVACITSMDADHLDIYGEAASLHDSFIEFTQRIKPGGTLFVRSGLPLEGITYGIEDDSDYCIKNIKVKNGTYVFDVETPNDGVVCGVQFNQPGQHNLLNGLVAFAMAVKIGSPTDRLVKALSTFKGVKRRFSYQIKRDDLVFIDDYAHHPTEIDAVHQAVREMYPEKKVLAIFQPHLFSRTRDFIDDFASSLSQFDEIMLLDIYPAREEPITGVTSSWLLERIKNDEKSLVSKDELIAKVLASNAHVILTLGAGDIGVEVESIKKALLN